MKVNLVQIKQIMIHPKIDKVKTTGLEYLFQEPLHTILSTLFAKNEVLK